MRLSVSCGAQTRDESVEFSRASELSLRLRPPLSCAFSDSDLTCTLHDGDGNEFASVILRVPLDSDEDWVALPKCGEQPIFSLCRECGAYSVVLDASFGTSSLALSAVRVLRHKAARATRFPFVGDGAHAGDGGASLQALHDACSWRPIAKCDGRYVCADHDWRLRDPEAVLAAAGCEAASAVLRIERADADAVVLVRLRGGGGLLSFVKDDGCFVHTLNTESGLCRKAIALGIVGTIEAAIAEPGAAAAFGILCHILAFLDDTSGERTRLGPAAGVAVRTSLARAAVAAATARPPTAEGDNDGDDDADAACAERRAAPLAAAAWLRGADRPCVVRCWRSALSHAACDVLAADARLLIADPDDGTFWLDRGDAPRCRLEQLAADVLRFHAGSDADAGAEWWVQARPLGAGERSSINLHWDKDESLSRRMGEHAPPFLSTVTYCGDDGAPTLVLPLEADERGHALLPDGGGDAYVSYPAVGKHLAFDGRLLHCAPQQLARSADASGGIRITLLVNVWRRHRPWGLRRLPKRLAERLDSGGPTEFRAEFRAEFRTSLEEEEPIASDAAVGIVLRRRPPPRPDAAEVCSWPVMEGVGEATMVRLRGEVFSP